MSERKEIDKLKDQVTLWLLLFKLKGFAFKTKRLKLQKLVYLIDIFGTILGRKPTTYTFQAYKMGPFSKEIYDDIERLVSIDAVKAKEVERWSPDRERSFEYEIEESRISKVEFLSTMKQLHMIENCVDFVVQAVGYLSGEQVRKLVYNEPNYVLAERKGFGTIIDPEYSLAIRFREVARKLASEEFGIQLTEKEVLWLYLALIKTELKKTKMNSEISAG